MSGVAVQITRECVWQTLLGKKFKVDETQGSNGYNPFQVHLRILRNFPSFRNPASCLHPCHTLHKRSALEPINLAKNGNIRAPRGGKPRRLPLNI